LAASRTAGFVALYRALESLERGRQPLFADPLAIEFLPPKYRALLVAARVPGVHGLLSRYADHRAPGARTGAIARTRFIDDSVESAVSEGIRQLVLLGAGFDCRAHRLDALKDVIVYEVDRLETQALKRGGLRAAAKAKEVRYVPLDFARDDTARALERAGHERGAPTMVVWEGVTNYLTERDVAAVLTWVGTMTAGSTIVFTYDHAGLLDGSVTFEGGEQILRNVRALGEPWTFGLRPEEVETFLSRFGLELVEQLGADDYRRRYLPTGSTGLSGYSFYRIAVARARGDT
jgi:methyltransferase (TIGR00027 family)